MNRRVFIFVLLAVVVLGAGLFLITGSKPKPTPAGTAVTTPAPAPAPAPVAPAPAPEAKAPAAPRASTEPRPRRAAPSSAPTTRAEPSTPAPAADAAMLKIEADVPDAQVFVDRVFLGKAPLTTTDVKPGSHRLNVSASGYEGIAQAIDVKPGMQEISVKLREVRLDAAIDVVHKHRMGSCKGRLVATPQGMRYETSDKDDAFRTGLLDLETFEIDYMNKNLRIKPKQGKRYDFTDPDGNADRLFVFHRDVTKAIDRLKKGDTPAEP